MTDQDPAHDRLQESVGLYVLGALDAAERAEFEAHLATCVLCTNEVRALGSVAAALPHAVPAIDPPASLRTRVMAVTGRHAVVPPHVVALPPRAQEPRRSWAGWLSAAALLVMASTLGNYTISLRRQIAGLRSELAAAVARLERSEQQVAVAARAVAVAETRMAVLTAPDLAQVDLQGQTVAPRASGRAFWSRTRGLVFTASNLPQVPSGRAYQLWVVTARAPVSAGLLQPDVNGAVAQSFSTPADILPPVAIAVTIEPEGGVPAPTGEKYLVGLTH